MLITGLSLAIIGLILLERKFSYNHSEPLIPRKIDRRASRQSLVESIDHARSQEDAEGIKRLKDSAAKVAALPKLDSPLDWGTVLSNYAWAFAVSVDRNSKPKVWLHHHNGEVSILSEPIEVDAYRNLLDNILTSTKVSDCKSAGSSDWKRFSHDHIWSNAIGVDQYGKPKVWICHANGEVSVLTEPLELNGFRQLFNSYISGTSVENADNQLQTLENDDSDDHNYFYEKIVYESDQ